jgi:hypothetical protein
MRRRREGRHPKLASELHLATESEDGAAPTLHKRTHDQWEKLTAMHDKERGSTSLLSLSKNLTHRLTETNAENKLSI